MSLAVLEIKRFLMSRDWIGGVDVHVDLVAIAFVFVVVIVFVAALVILLTLL